MHDHMNVKSQGVCGRQAGSGRSCTELYEDTAHPRTPISPRFILTLSCLMCIHKEASEIASFEV